VIDSVLKALSKKDADVATLRSSYKLLGCSGDKIEENVSAYAQASVDERKSIVASVKSLLVKEKEQGPLLLLDIDKAIKWAGRGDRGDYIPSGEMRAVFVKDKKEMSPTELVNYYRQKIVGANGEELGCIRRFGAICAWHQGLVAYPQLIDALQDDTCRQETVASLKKLKGKTPGQAEAIRDTVALFSSKDTLESAIRERTMILQQQALQAIYGHICDHARKITDGQEFAFLHLSLLNPSKEEIFDSGLGHFEKKQMIEMKAAFELFAGSEIVFTDDSSLHLPFIDTDGTLKMPRPQGMGKEVTSIVARPIFFNESVQNHEQKDLREQIDINHEGFSTLRRLAIENTGELSPEFDKLLKECERRNDQKESSYEGAEAISLLAQLLDLPISLNCFSAKDRTGYVAFLIMTSFLSAHIAKTVPNKKYAEKLVREFRSRGHDDEGVAEKIVEVNTGVRGIKVTPLKLPGVTGARAYFDRMKGFSRIFRSMVKAH
jgi:hypothetical protein